jgi:hypothetical protein
VQQTPRVAALLLVLVYFTDKLRKNIVLLKSSRPIVKDKQRQAQLYVENLLMRIRTLRLYSCVYDCLFFMLHSRRFG